MKVEALEFLTPLGMEVRISVSSQKHVGYNTEAPIKVPMNAAWLLSW